MPDSENDADRARVVADALEAKAASVADDLKDVAIEAAARLQATMQDLAGQMIVLANEMKSLSTYGQRNRRLIRLLAVSVAFDVLLSLGLGVLFLRSNHTAEATHQIVATRTEARTATCKSDNTFIANHNALVAAVEQAAQLVNTPNPSRTPEQQAQADRFVAAYQATVEQARVPLRECTPQAIDAFYKSGG